MMLTFYFLAGRNAALNQKHNEFVNTEETVIKEPVNIEDNVDADLSDEGSSSEDEMDVEVDVEEEMADDSDDFNEFEEM